MSADPVPSNPNNPTAPPSGGALVEFVAAQRASLAMVLLVFGLLSFGGGVYCGYRYLKPQTATLTKPAEEKAEAELEKLTPPRQPEYAAAAMLCLVFTIAGIGVGGWLMAGQPNPDPATQLRDARVAILLVGGLVGAGLMAFGLILFYLWFDSLLDWINRKSAAGAKYPLLSLMIFLIGAGLTFFATQPARVEERDNPLLRRLVYGTNVGLTMVLLVLMLVVGNVVAAMKLPAKLDTTESGLHSLKLSDSTREYLAALDKTIVIYALLPEQSDAVTLDTRRMLDAAREANPAHVEVRYLSPTLNKTEIDQLRNDFPQITLNTFGLLMTRRGDTKQASFLRREELYKSEQVPGTQEMKVLFQGESLFARELLALTEAKSQPIVYFTQSAGELTVVSDTATANATRLERPAAELRRALETINCKVQALTFDPANPNPAIPADADIVVVADPISPLSGQTVQAIEKFMNEPHGPDGKKKGRLIVLAAAHPKPAGGEGIMPTGLEPLLARFGITLTETVLYGSPNNALQLPSNQLGVAMNPNLVDDKNPIALTFEQRLFPVTNIRAVTTTPPAPQGQGPKAEPLMVTAEDRFTWLETEILANPERTWAEMTRAATPEIVQAKRIAKGLRPVAAIASDDAGSRIVVYGFGAFFSDETTRALRGKSLQADLFSASVNWLRDRPAIANIPAKTYGEYILNPKVDGLRLVVLPVGLCMMTILAVGLGVLVLRRS
ncbi:MAG: GldG family protein [Bacteroidales bacterium]|nr:GldG family protein [Bacteroidales bacterium]